MDLAEEIALAHLVARRFEARSGAALSKQLATAIKAFEAGDLQPLIEACAAVKAVFDPNGTTTNGIDFVGVSWLLHLSPIKQRNVLRLQAEAGSIVWELQREEAKGFPYGKERALDRLKKFLSGVKLLEGIIKADSGDDSTPEVSVEGMKVVVLPGVRPDEAAASMEALQAAADKLKGKFPQVLYGTVYLTPKLAGAAAHYIYNNDTIALSVRARKRFNDVFSLIHEFGHRYDSLFVDKAVRSEFVRLSIDKTYEVVTIDRQAAEEMARELTGFAVARRDGKPLPTMGEPLEQLMRLGPNEVVKPLRRLMSEVAAGREEPSKIGESLERAVPITFKTDRVLKENTPVSQYGGTSVAENFADAFAMFVLGVDMPPGYDEIMKKLR